MITNIKQLQEFILIIKGIKFDTNFEGCYIFNFDGLYLYRCSKDLILLNVGNDKTAIKIHLDEDKGMIFNSKHEMTKLLDALMERKADGVYTSFLGNRYYLAPICREDSEYYLLCSETSLVKCLMEVK